MYRVELKEVPDYCILHKRDVFSVIVDKFQKVKMQEITVDKCQIHVVMDTKVKKYN